MFSFVLELLNSTIFERLLNKYTPKGIVHLGIALILYKFGFSEKFIEIAINYNWKPLIILLTEYRYIISSIIIFLVMLGGFYVFKRDYPTIKLTTLKNKLDSLDLEVQIFIKQKELEKLKNGK